MVGADGLQAGGGRGQGSTLVSRQASAVQLLASWLAAPVQAAPVAGSAGAGSASFPAWHRALCCRSTGRQPRLTRNLLNWSAQ